MSIIIDLVLVAIIALFAFLGYRQGLAKLAIRIISFLIAIILTFIFYKPISHFIINNTQIDDNIQNIIIEKITSESMKQDSKIKVEDKLTREMVGGKVTNTLEEVAKAFSIKLIDVCVLLILFIILRIILKFISVLADLVAKLPVLKQINELRWHYIWIIERNNYYICNTCNCLYHITIY